MISLKECKEAIKPKLTEKRYRHSKCVSKAAAGLAIKYGADPEKAAVAGMLHDIMKDTAPEEQLKIIGRFDIILNDTEKKLPKLLHAISGAAYIEHYLKVRDQDIINAVRRHTSGRAGMSLLEKIVFIADFISEDRDYPGVDEIRRQADESLELAMYEGIKFTAAQLMAEKSYVDPNTIAAYNDVIDILNRRAVML